MVKKLNTCATIHLNREPQNFVMATLSNQQLIQITERMDGGNASNGDATVTVELKIVT